MKLSEHFTLKELTVSQTAVRFGLDNTPSDREVGNLQDLCKNVLEPVRTGTNSAIIVSSGYRSREVNKKVKGSKNSQHLEGKAADIISVKLSVKDLYNWIKHSEILYDQLIYEFDEWVHVSFNFGKNRRMNLIASKNLHTGKTEYTID